MYRTTIYLIAAFVLCVLFHNSGPVFAGLLAALSYMAGYRHATIKAYQAIENANETTKRQSSDNEEIQ